LGDYLAEKVIKGFAFFSIAIIVLIFIFVFREASPVFNTSKQVSVGEVVTEQQETYGEVTDTPLATEPAVYNGGDSNTVQSHNKTITSLNEPVSSGAQIENYSVSSGDAADDNKAALQTLLTKDWVPVSEKPRYGILSLIVGTFKVTLISILFAAPLAILAALYTANFAGPKMKEVIKPTIELLAGFISS
jgi:phosphate transport system permease protein